MQSLRCEKSPRWPWYRSCSNAPAERVCCEHKQRTARPSRFLFDSANRERMEQGLVAAQVGRAIGRGRAASTRQLMARQNTLSHQFPGEPEPAARVRAGWSPIQRAGRECCRRAQYPAEIHQGWMNSPPHRKNLLDPQLNSVGIAVVARGEAAVRRPGFRAHRRPVVARGPGEPACERAAQGAGAHGFDRQRRGAARLRALA
jgi:hypothetical protein